MKKITAFFALTLGLFITTAFFQNCAEDIDMQEYATTTLPSSAILEERMPQIISAPLNVAATLSQPLSVVVTTAGPNLTYRWSKSGMPLSQFTTHELTIASVQASDAGSYTLEVSNSAGSRSVTILVTVTQLANQTPPTITSITPTVTATLTMYYGEITSASPASVTFAVVAASETPMTYQWFFVNSTGTATPISAATQPEYRIATIDGEGAGKYRVEVTNANGTVFAETTLRYAFRNLTPKSPYQIEP